MASRPAPGDRATARVRSAARGVGERIHPGRSVVRAVQSAPAALQIVAAALLAYSVAHYGLGHPAPALSLTVTISSLGLGRDARPKRVAESALGMVLGIALSETFLLLWGSGVWQLAVVLGIVLLVARALSPSAGFAVAAAVQAMLVLVLPAPDGGVYTRSLDGLLGGAAALLCTAIVPRNPLRNCRSDARRLLADLSATIESLVVALRGADREAAAEALDRVRGTQPVIDDWAASLESAVGVARISPFVRRHRAELERQRGMLAALDLATRNLRIVARRTDFLIGDGLERPRLAELVGTFASGVSLLERSISEPRLARAAQQDLTLLATSLDPGRVLPPEARLAEKTLVVILRPLAVDLLTATGVPADEARAALPAME